MADIKQQLIDFGIKIGLLKNDGTSPAPKTNVTQVSKNSTPKQKFDFNKFLEVSKTYWGIFFKQEIPMFFKDPNKYLKNYGTWFKTLQQDEQIAHVLVYSGSVFIVTGIVLMIVGI